MTDLELAKFLAIADQEQWPDIIAKLDPAKRSEYERAHERSTQKTMNKATFNVSCAVLGLISLGFIGEIISPPPPAQSAAQQTNVPTAAAAIDRIARNDAECVAGKARIVSEGRYFASAASKPWPNTLLVSKWDDYVNDMGNVLNRMKDARAEWQKLRGWCTSENDTAYLDQLIDDAQKAYDNMRATLTKIHAGNQR
jgi:hypothetical protein